MMNAIGHSRSFALFLLGILIPGILQSCAIAGRHLVPDDLDTKMLTTGSRGVPCCVLANGVPRQTALAQAAVGLIGRSRIEVEGRRYASDCSGFVRGVYAAQQVDLYDGLGELDGGNGVGRIYTHVVEHGRIHYGPTVHPGDLVFFHNTWDFNRDGLPNDPLTHVGIVETVERDGTVIFVSWVSAGVDRYRMNLRHPGIHKTAEGRVLNDHIRRKGSGDQETIRYLTGQLFAAFGTRVR
jgi:probable lipoprotein NlpC